MVPFTFESDNPLLTENSHINFVFETSELTRLENSPALLAGAAEVDITPPPGLPKAGYSSNAHNGIGFRSRLKARILHLRTGESSIAIVFCDLLGGSSIIQHLVAKTVESSTDIPLSGLFIGGTHTHAGPGQYLGTDFYNRFASNKSGFDPRWAQFLISQISNGVIEAYETRVPAKIAVGSKDIFGLTRNRSLAPHVRNNTIEDKRVEAQRKFFAINPDLNLIRVDAVNKKNGTTSPLGCGLIFSMHGTGISMKSHLYNADIWSYITESLRNKIKMEYGLATTVGAMEGTHADVAPAIRANLQGFVESQRIGIEIGSAAFQLYQELDSKLQDTIELKAGFKEINLEKTRKLGNVTLPNHPAVGAALIAGAKENVTPVINKIPPFKAGYPKPHLPSDSQGAKWVLGSKWLQPIFLPLSGFPRIIPLHALKIDNTVIVGLPFEITVESGRRIANAAKLEFPNEKIVVSSVANEYCGYVATPEEYSLQYYEGGHTLYGPNTAAFLSQAVKDLAKSLKKCNSGHYQSPVKKRSFKLKIRNFLKEIPSGEYKREIISNPIFHDPENNEFGYWELVFRDSAPSNISWHEPIVSVERFAGSKFSIESSVLGDLDDRNPLIEVSSLGYSDINGYYYRVRWFDPTFQNNIKHRFKLHKNNGSDLVYSESFD